MVKSEYVFWQTLQFDIEISYPEKFWILFGAGLAQGRRTIKKEVLKGCLGDNYESTATR